MTIKVFIPTYKRLNTLKAVMYSLFKTYIPNEQYQYECYIVNNYTGNYNEVEQLVAEFDSLDTIWTFKSIQREITLPPIENWYSAISEYTKDGEIAFLQGDDDLFLPESIRYRVNCIINNNADLLLTKHIGGVVFYDNTPKVSVTNFEIREQNEQIKDVIFENLWSAIFIGNNTYKMSAKLREAFELAMKWCNEQTWLTFDQRTLMYPIYIPIALNLMNAKVIDSNQEAVIRSMNIDECRRALWNVPGWNSGFLHLAFYGVLNNADLKNNKTLETTRISANDFAASWYWTFFFDPRISKQIRVETFKRIGKPKFNNKTFINSIIFITKGILSKYNIIRKLKTLIKPPKNLIHPTVFIERMYER